MIEQAAREGALVEDQRASDGRGVAARGPPHADFNGAIEGGCERAEAERARFQIWHRFAELLRDLDHLSGRGIGRVEIVASQRRRRRFPPALRPHTAGSPSAG